MASIGTVSSWSADEGWGVIASPDTPGGCWAHYSNLEMQGYHSLEPGEVVDFEWERADQDGFAYRALKVRPRNPKYGGKLATIAAVSTPGYGSTLAITSDSDPKAGASRATPPDIEVP